MNEVTKAFIFGLITFLIIFIIYYFFILKEKFDAYNGKTKKKKKKQEKPLDFIEFTYLVSKFQLDKDKINVLFMFRGIAFLNAFIISVTGTIIYYIPVNMIIKFIIGFVMVFALIYALYELFGRLLVKKGWSKK